MLVKYLLNTQLANRLINTSSIIRTKIHPTPAKVKKVNFNSYSAFPHFSVQQNLI